MCGINVIIGKNRQEDIQTMMQSTKHRGPDHSSSCEVTPNLFFAGNRLKILDLSSYSDQPLWSPEKDALLVWNGALYNYQDLRNTLLEQGYQFQSNSDSEVLLYWLKQFGQEGIKDLKGMFALAFADMNKNKIIIARDPSGEKPLYYANKKDTYYFSSEVQAIQNALSEKSSIDKDQFAYYYYLRHPNPQDSFFIDIKQFPVGTCTTFSLKGKKMDEFHWPPKSQSKEKPSQHLFEDLLKSAVLKNCHAERPVGMMLSGGADSSLIYALWYEETGEPLPAFTIQYTNNLRSKYADPNFVQQLGKRYPLLYHPVEVNFEKVQTHWQAYVASLDQPIGDSASFLTWLLAKEASDNCKVLISGAGADELFGGYNRHIAYKYYLQYPNLWLNLKKMGLIHLLPERISKFLDCIHHDREETFIQMAALENIPKALMEKIKPYYPKGKGAIINALEWDRTWYLVNDILKVHDNACMTHGVEGRSPYLDQDLITLSQSMTEEEHLQQLGKKWIKSELQKRNLGIIANRKKLGFGLPLKEWLQQKDFRNWVFEPIEKMGQNWGQNFPEEMRNLALNPTKAKDRQYLQIWNLFILASWIAHKSP